MESFFFTSSRGITYHYQTIKNVLPEDTVFLHGNLASNRWWHPIIDVLKQKSTENPQGSMILIEMPGCGLSAAPHSAADMNLIGFAQDWSEFLREYGKSQHLKTFNLVGHSTGGFVAAAMTALNPELFNKAVLLNPPGANGLVLTEAIKNAYIKMQTDKSFTAQAIGATIYNNDYDSEFFRTVILEDAFSAVKKISYWIVEAFHNIGAEKLMRNSSVPSLVLFGAEDRMLSASDAQALAEIHLRNARFESVPRHGHSMNVEDPEAFVKKMSEFLFSENS
jgi:pimeloyl-ACP methyl ester carboxylesterase